MKMRFLMAFLFLLATGCFDSRPSQPGYYPSYGPARQTYVYPAPYPPRYVEPEPQEWPNNGPHYVEPQEWPHNEPHYAEPEPNNEYREERAEQQEKLQEQQEKISAEQQAQHHEQQEMHQEQQQRNRAEQRERHQANQHNGQPDND